MKIERKTNMEKDKKERLEAQKGKKYIDSP